MEMAPTSSSVSDLNSPAQTSWIVHGHGRILYPVLAVLNVLILLLLLYYLRGTSICRQGPRVEDADSTDTSSSAGNSPSASARREASVSSDVLSSIPVFVYSMDEDGGREKLECSVCLTEFMERDKGRRLPACGHRFHASCIEVWFQSHSTCPICRSHMEAINATQLGDDAAV